MNRRWITIGSFPVTFTERRASQFKITVKGKSTKQPATQPVNHTNQLQKNIAQPAKQHISETTYRRNIYKLNNPRLS